MKRERSWGVVAVAAYLAAIPNSSSLAGNSCDYVFSTPNIKDGALINLNHTETLFNGERTISFGYVVPQSGYQTGVFIVKSQHKLASVNSSATQSTISLEREEYSSPCTGRVFRKYANNAVDSERYIDYYFYQLVDSEPNQTLNLDSANADVGFRQFKHSWRPTSTGCLNTRHSTIRAQFLYGDDRRAASVSETLRRQYALFSGAVGTPAAYAAPPAYAGYSSLKTIVVPYAKNDPRARACFAFNLPLPRNTVATTVMIVDADQAFAHPDRDPQRSWTFTWKPRPARSTLNRH
jgi:hypothetical protein